MSKINRRNNRWLSRIKRNNKSLKLNLHLGN